MVFPSQTISTRVNKTDIYEYLRQIILISSQGLTGRKSAFYFSRATFKTYAHLLNHPVIQHMFFNLLVIHTNQQVRVE